MGPLICTADWFWVCYQIPHFLALAWLCRADYARGGYSMLPLLDAAGRRTGACMLRNCLYLLPLGPAALAAGVAGPAFACTASVATGVFAATAAAFARTPSAQAARSVFRASLIYLPVILAAALLDRVPRQPTAAGCRTRWDHDRTSCCVEAGGVHGYRQLSAEGASQKELCPACTHMQCLLP